MKKLLRVLGAAMALTLAQASATAQTYPARPITLIVPHGAGGANDAVGRAFAHKLGTQVDQSVVVDNRPGAGGNIGTALVAKAPRDGYTLLMTVGSSHTINPSLYKAPGFDPVKSFEPIALVGTAPYVLVVNPDLPVKSVQDLVALAKARPGQIHMASAGNGTLDHLLGEMFKAAAAVDLVHVPYKGAAAANTDLVSGQVSVTFTSWPSVMSFVKAGKLRLLAQASETRSALLPEVPTIHETVRGVSAVSWYGLLAPAGTPAPVLERLRVQAAKVVADPQFQEGMRQQGAEASAVAAPAFAQLIASDLRKWEDIVRATGARID
ncbi:MAG TPA: tripartite tricarboxylate transporter substrate binding protein [Pseudorhodoferax sp.]|nr:tripartite tricarboxylate transporter substrate binding protein [Pseudorhodoferax sp.]